MIDLLRVERRFERQRAVAADVRAAYREALRACGAGPSPGPAGRLRRAGERVVRALDRAAAGGELPYHNRHHAAEATLAMGWLCAAARRRNDIGALDAVVGVTAMVGHDLGHDGTAARDGRLEQRAAAAVDAIATVARVPPRLRRQLAEVIRATDPAMAPRNAARALGPLPAGRSGRGVAMLRLLANEADVLASLLPGLGWTLGRALAAEGAAAAVPGAAAVATHAGRLGFLRAVPRFSPAARRLGLAAVRDQQVAARARMAALHGAADAACPS